MLDTPCSEVVWRVLATHCIRQFPLHFPSLRHRVPSHLNWSLMLDTTCSEVVWRVLATHSIRQFPLNFPSRASPFAITFQLKCNAGYTMFRDSVKSTGYPLHSPVFPSLPSLRYHVPSHFNWSFPTHDKKACRGNRGIDPLRRLYRVKIFGDKTGQPELQ